MKPILALIACAVLCLAGCNWSLKPDSAQTQAAKIAVQYGTLRYLGGVPEAERPGKAERVRLIVAQVEKFAKGEPVSLALLESAVRDQLPQNMRPEDAFAVNALLGLVMAELQARVGDGLLTEQQVLIVSEVAQWISSATEYYGATS